MKKLLYSVIGCVLAIAFGIKELVPTIKLLVNTVINGVDWTIAHLEQPSKDYLKGLRRLTTFTFLPPFLISIIAFFTGGNTAMGWMGVWCFVWTLVLGTYASPLGALIDSLATAGREGAWAKGETGLLARRLKSYISFVRQILIYEAAAFLTLNIVPMQNYWAGVPVFLLIIGLLIITSYEWGTRTGRWLKPLARFASFTALGLLLVRFCIPSLLPGVNFFNLIWYHGNPETLVEKGALEKEEAKLRGMKDITEDHVWGVFTGSWKWVGEHWIGVTIGVAVVFLLVYLAVRLFKKATTTAAGTGGSDHGTTTASAHGGGEGRGSGWLGKAVAVVVLLLGVGLVAMMVMKAMELHERRNAYIEESMRQARTHEVAWKAMQTTSALVAQVNGRVATQAPAPAPVSSPVQEVWYGLVNPKKYSLVLSTNLSERILLPPGCSTRMEPRGLYYELWANGKLVPQSPNGPTKFPPDTTFVQYRWTNPAPMSVIVGVGKKVK